MTDQQFMGVTPTGRMISGAIFQPSSKGYQGKQLETPVYYIQIAIPKTDPGLPALFGNIQGAAAAGFFAGENQRQDFAWKFKDGDLPENSQKEGWAGCFVFTFRTTFAPNAIVDINSQQIIDPHAIKPGYQVRVAYSCKANGNAQKPGVYLNFNMVQLVSVDKEIQTGPAASEVFAAPAAPLPMQPGAIPSVPGVPAPQAPPAVPGYQAPPAVPVPQAPPVAPVPQAPPVAPSAPVQPDQSFLYPPGTPTVAPGQ